MKASFLALSTLLAVLPFSLRADEKIVWGITEVDSATHLLLFNSSFQLLKEMPTGLVDLTGLSLNPVDKKLYVMQGGDAPTRHLMTLAKKSGAATPIGDDTGTSISDTGFSDDGTLFAVGEDSPDLFRVNLTTGALTTLATGAAKDSEAGVTVDQTGQLFVADFNQLIKFDPATGKSLSTVPLDGNFNNILFTDSGNRLVGGLHNEAATVLFFVDPVTGASEQRGSFGSLDLKGVAFDSAPPPKFKLDGGAKITTSKRSITLKGTFNSVVPCIISGKGFTVQSETGKWKLTISGLKRGKQQFTLRCVDLVGQKAAPKTITVTVQ